MSSALGSLPDTQRVKIVQVSVDLSQAAGTYTLLTCTSGVSILGAEIYCSVVGATFTSVAIQTNHTTADVILSATEGAVANLTAGKNITKAFTGPIYLADTKLITYTMAGSTGTGTLLMDIRYMSSVSGAKLA